MATMRFNQGVYDNLLDLLPKRPIPQHERKEKYSLGFGLKMNGSVHLLKTINLDDANATHSGLNVDGANLVRLIQAELEKATNGTYRQRLGVDSFDTIVLTHSHPFDENSPNRDFHKQFSHTDNEFSINNMFDTLKENGLDYCDMIVNWEGESFARKWKENEQTGLVIPEQMDVDLSRNVVYEPRTGLNVAKMSREQKIDLFSDSDFAELTPQEIEQLIDEMESHGNENETQSIDQLMETLSADELVIVEKELQKNPSITLDMLIAELMKPTRFIDKIKHGLENVSKKFSGREVTN
ncbi:MAG: hypothetical protein FWE16_03390 [Firmicutes bacterium]|nr:hypothetical protein [Bacillota bacterium]